MLGRLWLDRVRFGNVCGVKVMVVMMAAVRGKKMITVKDLELEGNKRTVREQMTITDTKEKTAGVGWF